MKILESIYAPAEDSFLLADAVKLLAKKMLKRNTNAKVLDMGTGSGILAETALEAGSKKENILTTDINIGAVREMKAKGFNAVKSDLFSKIRGKFDLIIFNPPYLPADKHDMNIDTCGGKKGYETALRFIKGLKSHLSEKGAALLLISSFTSPEILKKEMKARKLAFRKLASKRMFFEELYVWLVSSPNHQ
ncbi:MAG: HemK2/MTQ2 family protein methyltransferase [archaeon]